MKIIIPICTIIRADIKLIELAKKEQETLDVWRNNVEPFSVWLEDINGKIEEIQSNWTSIENLNEKHLSLQVDICSFFIKKHVSHLCVVFSLIYLARYLGSRFGSQSYAFHFSRNSER